MDITRIEREYQLANSIMAEYGLIKPVNPSSKYSIFTITDIGIDVTNQGGILAYLQLNSEKNTEKENLEMQNLKTENILLTDQLFDLQKMKRQRNLLFIVAIVELAAILIGLFLQLITQS